MTFCTDLKCYVFKTFLMFINKKIINSVFVQFVKYYKFTDLNPGQQLIMIFLAP